MHTCEGHTKCVFKYQTMLHTVQRQSRLNILEFTMIRMKSLKKEESSSLICNQIDIFSFSRVPLWIFGLYFNDSFLVRPNWIVLLQKVHLVVMKVLSIVAIIGEVYAFIIAGSQEVRATMPFMLIFYIFQVVMYFKGCGRMPYFTIVLGHVRKQLTEQELRKLRKIDRISTLIRVLLLFTPTILTASQKQNIQKVQNLMESFFNHNKFLMWSHHLTSIISFMAMMCLSHIYHQVIRVARTFAQNRQNKIRDILKDGHLVSSKAFNHTRIYIEDSLFFVKSINQNSGSIPFTALAFLFLWIIFGSTVIVTYRELQLSYSLIIIGGMIANQAILLLQIIHESQQLEGVIKKSIEMGKRLVTTPLTEMGSRVSLSVDVLEARRSLTIFLEQTPLESLTAMGCFTLNFNLVFNFFNAVVPFTIMSITAISELRSKNTVVTNEGRYRISYY